MLSTQAVNVVGSMEKMWTGAGAEGAGAAGNGGAASAAQQQARLEQAIASSEFGEDEYVQVRWRQALLASFWMHGVWRCSATAYVPLPCEEAGCAALECT